MAITYGTYTFPGGVETTALSIVPTYDKAGRAVIYNTIRVTLRWFVAGTAIDAGVRRVVSILSKPAARFVYANSGYGLSVNVSTVRDVLWGPRPSEVTVKPQGGGNAVEMTWTVEVCIPHCDDAVYRFAPMEFNFTLAYSIDASGYTTRTYAGFLRIPMTRPTPDARVLPDNIDTYRESVYPPLIVGYRRTPGTWTINEAKNRADFSCTDEQMNPNIPPAGVVQAEADHTFTSTPGNPLEWTGTLTASYEIARNGRATAHDAAAAFLALARDRIYHFSDRYYSGLITAGVGGRSGRVRVAMLPVSFTLAEPQIYGRTTARFSMTYKTVGADLASMIASGGLWRPVPGNNWNTWAASLGDVLGPRGHGGLRFRLNDDRIVDLCRETTPGPPYGSDGWLRELRTGRGTTPAGLFPAPKPDSSYLYYRLWTYLETDSGTVATSTLPTSPRSGPGDLYGSTTAIPTATAAISTIPGILNAVLNPKGDKGPQQFDVRLQKAGGLDLEQTPQRRGRQTGVLFVTGEALRLGYTIPAPEVGGWGAATLTPANRQDYGEGFWTGVVGHAGYPVVYARWKLRFLLDTIPAEAAPAIPNPMLGGNY